MIGKAIQGQGYLRILDFLLYMDFYTGITDKEDSLRNAMKIFIEK